MKKIVIYGAGGLGREVLALVDAINSVAKEWQFVGFVDDDPARSETIGTCEYLENTPHELHVVIAIGNPSARRQVYEKVRHINRIQFPVLVHPAATIMHRSVKVGEGSIITAGSIVTTDVHIGRHVLVNLNATIGHNTTIGDFTSVMPGTNIAGEVTLGDAVLVGSGASVLNGLIIGDNVTIGSGSVVNKPIASGKTVAGMPARSI